MKSNSLIVVMLFACIVLVFNCKGEAQTVASLRVMSYNIWVGGAANGPLSRTVGVIQAAQADVIGIQEGGGNVASIANSLGFYYSGSIISRYPIAETLNQGVRLLLSPGQDAYVFNVHLAAYPYQPYDIRDGLITTEAQAIAGANATRSACVSTLLIDMAPALSSPSPVFLTGDFNEPSHLDWTQAAANAGLHFGMKVDWPTSRAVTNAGLTDSFRDVRPDVINDPGNTWTPGYPAPNLDANEVQDRIDFVYYSGPGVAPTSAQILGYNANDGSTDIAIQPYPSDHRAVVTEFNLPTCSLADLSGNCIVGVEDWTQFRAGQQANMTGLTHAQAYALGDLNGDFRNDHTDFVTFKAAFDAANGSGAFLAVLQSVPEPSVLVLIVSGGIGFLRRRRDSSLRSE